MPKGDDTMRFRGGLLSLVALLVVTAVASFAEDQPGNIDIRSTLIGTRVYLDDAYVGDADIFLEDVPAGQHIIILRQGSQRIRTEVTLKPGELLMLEGRFEESRIVDLKQVAREEAEKRAEAERLAAAQRAADAEQKKQEQAAEKKKESKKAEPKKAESRKAEPKKAEEKKVVVATAKATTEPGSEQRDLHLNIIRVDFEENPQGIEVKVVPRVNQKIVTNFNDSSSSTGKIVRKKEFVLCEGEGCFRDWTGRFFYFDDTGKRDAFLLRWRETVFTGMTPSGTSKVDIDLCVNGDCKRVAYSNESGAAVQTVMDRYVLNFNRKVLTIRRADIMKEITNAGGKVPDF